MQGRYVVDENGDRVAVLLEIEEYERMAARESACQEQPEEDFDPEQSERRITEFITSADELPGPPVAALAERVAASVRAAWTDVEGITSGHPHNKVLATQLFLSQRARGMQADDPEQWQLFAATTLLSGMVVRSVNEE